MFSVGVSKAREANDGSSVVMIEDIYNIYDLFIIVYSFLEQTLKWFEL